MLLLRAAVALCMLAVCSAGEDLLFATVGADGRTFGIPGAGGGKKAKRSKPDSRDAIPQVVGEGPILPPGVYLQFPACTEPRSVALAQRRRAVLLTDGAIYQKEESLFFGLWKRQARAIPYAYVIDAATGESTFNMQFVGRRALPYGIAEDPRVSCSERACVCGGVGGGGGGRLFVSADPISA